MANNQFNLLFVADLDRGITLTPLRQAFLQDDHQAHVFTIKTTNGGAENTLTGATVTGYFIPQGADTAVQLTGNVNTDGTATVALTRDCYAFVGRFHLVIHATIGSVVSSIFYGEGYVARTRTDKVIEPSDAAPSLGTLEQMIKNLTYADVGAAPSGYGIGGISAYADDFDTALVGGIYYYNSSTANKPSGLTNAGVIFVENRADAHIWQTVKDSAGRLIRRVSTATVPGEWEWENPDMNLGVEYRTTERWGGNVVYAKCVSCGSWLDQKSISVPVDNCYRVTRYEAVAGDYCLPFIYNKDLNGKYTAYVRVSRTSASNIDVKLCGGLDGNAGTYATVVTVFYAKNE